MPAKKIILNIENHTPYPALISILGGLQDPNQYNVNSATEYLYDVGNFNWDNSSTWTLQFKRVGAASFSIKQGSTGGNPQQFLIALNLSSLGLFNYLKVDANISLIYTFNDYYEFGLLNIN
jgi:hypothetical protein